MAFADDVVSVLSEAGCGTYATDLFIGSAAKMPSGNGPYGSVIATSGLAPVQSHEDPRHLRRPGAQVMFRATDAAQAEAMAERAHGAIAAVANRPIGSAQYLRMRPTQEPFDLGPDDQGRVRFAFNVLADVSR